MSQPEELGNWPASIEEAEKQMQSMTASYAKHEAEAEGEVGAGGDRHDK